ncbi:MAG: hypothetical protein WA726_01710, partial [Acidimicrobiia bacterium]
FRNTKRRRRTLTRFRAAGVMWLVAAVLSAATTVVFRDDSAWYAITLVASTLAVVLGIMLLWRPNSASVLMSTIGGVVWVVLYAVLIAIQSDDLQAWTADAFFVVLGGAAAFISARAGRELAV